VSSFPTEKSTRLISKPHVNRKLNVNRDTHRQSRSISQLCPTVVFTSRMAFYPPHGQKDPVVSHICASFSTRVRKKEDLGVYFHLVAFCAKERGVPLRREHFYREFPRAYNLDFPAGQTVSEEFHRDE